MSSLSVIDITDKPSVYREAITSGFIKLKPETIKLIEEGKIAKGDPISVAKLAGVMAAKQTHLLIPLTHPIPLTNVSVEPFITETGIGVNTTVKTTYKTGCEIDSLVATSIALLTIFDMVKKYDPEATITDIKVVKKVKRTSVL